MGEAVHESACVYSSLSNSLRERHFQTLQQGLQSFATGRSLTKPLHTLASATSLTSNMKRNYLLGNVLGTYDAGERVANRSIGIHSCKWPQPANLRCC